MGEVLGEEGHRALRSVIRMDARLDPMTRQKVDDLARHFHLPRAAIVCQVMRWGLNRRQTVSPDQGYCQGPVCHLYLHVEADLHGKVAKAATAAGIKIAPWLRHMVRQIIMADFPMSWQEATSEKRSHDSHVYGTRFMLRLDGPSEAKLQQLVKQFGASKAEIIRQLIMQATAEEFPTRWRMGAAEPPMPPMRGQRGNHRASPH